MNIRDELMEAMSQEWLKDMDEIYIDCLINGYPLPLEWGFTERGFEPTQYQSVNS